MNRGNVLVELNRCDDALDSYGAALLRDASLAEAYDGRGNALVGLNRCDEAVVAYDRALALSPTNSAFLIHRGYALSRCGRYVDALASFDAAIVHDFQNAETHAGRASVLMELRRFAEAVESYSRALELNPSRVQTLYGRGSALAELGRYPDAIRDLRELLTAHPDYPYALGMLVHAQHMSCDWTDSSAEERMIAQLRGGNRVASPFVMLAASDSPSDLLQCARIVMRDRFPPSPQPLARNAHYRHDRIRLAYVSADFHEHPVGQLIAPVIGSHNRARFEVTAISYGVNDNSALRQQFKRSFDRFVDAAPVSDRDAARQMRELEIDIAVDLTGLTANSRPGILSFRPAPVQVNYLGYPGSLGSSAIDYAIADRMVIPENEQQFYDERVAWLPGTFLPPRVAAPLAAVSREAAGLPQRAFVFACFNTSYKFNARIFPVWMRLLARLNGSVLWLSRTNATAAENLKRQAQRYGISPARLIFAPRVPSVADHLARLACADLFLDTLPYNAHSTATDALAAGVPVLTCHGNSFAGRVAASLMQQAGLPEFVTLSLDEYETRAIDFANQPDRLAAAKAALRACGGFNVSDYTRHLETAYEIMWMRAEQGLPPQSFTIAGPAS
jgi:predicted O-linked N-acetylglucosamine transferase (SPINDLY family)